MTSELSIDRSQNQAKIIKGVALSPSIVSGTVCIADIIIIFDVGLIIYLGYVGWNLNSAPLYLITLLFNLDTFQGNDSGL